MVSRGGRPDLATRLEEVKAPKLLIVGGNDTTVLELNSAASRLLTCTRQLEVIPGATHLFEEPGTLEAVLENEPGQCSLVIGQADGTGSVLELTNPFTTD